MTSMVTRLIILLCTVVNFINCELRIRDDSACRMMLVESIPTNLSFSPGSPRHPSTYEAWLWLLGNATTSLNISSLYWTLRNHDVTPKYCPTSVNGTHILQLLLATAHGGKVAISVVNNGKTLTNDLSKLRAIGGHVSLLDVERLLGAGVLHTKMWTVDGIHAYLGSANMDWRSLTEVKELGVFFYKCPTLVKDLSKIQTVYRLLSGQNTSVPSRWPSDLETSINMTNPLIMNVSGVESEVYFGSSPQQFLPNGRTVGIEALKSVISKANKFVYISVMDYFPLVINYTHGGKNTFWPEIDDELRRVVINRKVHVRLLISHWKHTSWEMWNYLRSLVAIGSRSVPLEIKTFEVSGWDTSTIPFARVQHDKYMVTDNTAYIGTSNWSGDYFLYTCGVGLVIKERQNSSSGMRGQLQAVFERDWNSQYAKEFHLNSTEITKKLRKL